MNEFLNKKVVILKDIVGRDYTSEGNATRLKYAGHTGKIIDMHNSHGECYDVQFNDGIATFDKDEFVIV